MKYIFKILSTLLFPLTTYATGQVADILIFRADTMLLFSNPLEQYLDQKAERTLCAIDLKWTSTACYRGYQATWEVVNDSLFLLSVQRGCYSKVPEYFDLTEEFGYVRVFAGWFSGDVLAPKGTQIHYVHSGYDSFYERELILSFKQGRLIREIEYDNTQSHKSLFSEDNDTLSKFIYSNINWSKIPDLGEKTERVFISIQSGETVKPDSIQVVRASNIELINDEAIRVIKLLPEWSVYYRRGEVYRMRWMIPIFFNEDQRKENNR